MSTYRLLKCIQYHNTNTVFMIYLFLFRFLFSAQQNKILLIDESAMSQR